MPHTFFPLLLTLLTSQRAVGRGSCASGRWGAALLTPQPPPEAIASLMVASWGHCGQLCGQLGQLPNHSSPIMWTCVSYRADPMSEPVLTHGAQQVKLQLSLSFMLMLLLLPHLWDMTLLGLVSPTTSVAVRWAGTKGLASDKPGFDFAAAAAV